MHCGQKMASTRHFLRAISHCRRSSLAGDILDLDLDPDLNLNGRTWRLNVAVEGTTMTTLVAYPAQNKHNNNNNCNNISSIACSCAYLMPRQVEIEPTFKWWCFNGRTCLLGYHDLERCQPFSAVSIVVAVSIELELDPRNLSLLTSLTQITHGWMPFSVLRTTLDNIGTKNVRKVRMTSFCFVMVS